MRSLLGMAVVFVLALASQPAQAQCAGACGGGSADGTCFCDDACFQYGDCCGDVCDSCPELSGCGGGGGGGGACGNVTYEGCCEGELLKYCEGGQLKTIDCNQNPSCGWQAEGNFYDCATSGGQDPSGASPKSCGGGGTTPICGNGACEAGENANTCPADCGGGTKCGNGICEQGESVGCPADCGGGTKCGNGVCEAGENSTTCPGDCASQPSGCGDKECGFDSNGNSCGSCPAGFFCNWKGKCESNEPCTPQCSGKQCGSDGCGSTCGTCPGGLVCSGDGLCVSPYAGEDVAGEDDVPCIPSCQNKVCGSDGCGGTCGACPEGFGCNDSFMCEEGFIEPDPVDPEDPYVCPEGQTLKFGKCLNVGEEETKKSDGCTAGAQGNAAAVLLLLGLIAALSVPLRSRS